jgi:biopolymer transport protein TolR
MGMDVGTSSGKLSTPNIVPLIDILLVLIIIFMVITPQIPTGLPTLMPQPSKDPPPTRETVVVQVNADNKLKINNEDVSWDRLGPRMEEIFKERAEKVAFVKGDKDVLFTEVAHAIDIMRGAGMDKIGLITAKLDAGE